MNEVDVTSNSGSTYPAGWWLSCQERCQVNMPAEKLRAGERAAIFPAGSFPPALPFVGA